MKTLGKPTLFTLLVATAFATSLSCGTPPQKTAQNNIRKLADRRVLKVCAPKRVLARKDLEEIAKTYNPRRPNIGDIMQANDECAKTAQQETLDLGKCEASSLCATGIVKVPID